MPGVVIHQLKKLLLDMSDLTNKKLYVLSVIATLFIFYSCSNPASSDDEDEHNDPFGVALVMDGVEIATQENEEVTYHEGDHLELDVGEETSLITIRWIAEDGDRFEAHADEGYSLRWEIDNEDVLEVEQHEEDGPWSFHLAGIGAGETHVEFELWHNNHSDFTSSPFEVHIEEVVAIKAN